MQWSLLTNVKICIAASHLATMLLLLVDASINPPLLQPNATYPLLLLLLLPLGGCGCMQRTNPAVAGKLMYSEDLGQSMLTYSSENIHLFEQRSILK